MKAARRGYLPLFEPLVNRVFLNAVGCPERGSAALAALG